MAVRGDEQKQLQTGGAPGSLPPDRGVGLALVVGLFALVALFLGIAAIVVAFNRPKGAAESSSSEVNGAISLSEFAIKGDLTLAPGRVKLTITNNGSQVHNLSLKGGAQTPNLQPGQVATLDLGKLAAGNYELSCLIPGHADSGMKATLKIAEGAPAPGSAAAGTHELDYAQMDKDMLATIKKFPAATKGKGNTLLQPKLVDGFKVFDVTASIIDWEVEPGKIVKAWAYNEQVPGPVLKVNVGDKVRLNVTNNLPISTDVHMHGVSLPNEMDGVAGVTQDPIAPNGGKFTYEFTAEKPAVAMYHAHIHGQMQVPNGLFGAFLIGDVPLPKGRTIGGISIPADLKVSQEFPMVLNDAGNIGLSLNAKSFPGTEPIVAKVGDWIEVHYMNEGLQVHPMHPHQFPQLVIARDGIPLDSPYWADTLAVAPGERYTVLMHIDKPGAWVWHCHILNHVEREQGMFGMVTAIVANP